MDSSSDEQGVGWIKNVDSATELNKLEFTLILVEKER
jgi:hypothetical protein